MGGGVKENVGGVDGEGWEGGGDAAAELMSVIIDFETRSISHHAKQAELWPDIYTSKQLYP